MLTQAGRLLKYPFICRNLHFRFYPWPACQVESSSFSHVNPFLTSTFTDSFFKNVPFVQGKVHRLWEIVENPISLKLSLNKLDSRNAFLNIIQVCSLQAFPGLCPRVTIHSPVNVSVNSLIQQKKFSGLNLKMCAIKHCLSKVTFALCCWNLITQVLPASLQCPYPAD